MSTIEVHDIKAKKKVSMNNPKPYLMKNGSWALKGTRSETEINLFKIVVRQKPVIDQSRIEVFKNLFTCRQCECDRQC
jgi:hypothetical protein